MSLELFCWSFWCFVVHYEVSESISFPIIQIRMPLECHFKADSQEYFALNGYKKRAIQSPHELREVSTVPSAADAVCVHILSAYRPVFFSSSRFDPANIRKKLRSHIGTSSAEYPHLHSCPAGGQFFNAGNTVSNETPIMGYVCCCWLWPVRFQNSRRYIHSDRHCRGYSEF